MDQKTTILLFIGVALGILALAFFLSKAFNKSIKREKHQYDLNRDEGDGTSDGSGHTGGHATWIAIDKTTNGIPTKNDLDLH